MHFKNGRSLLIECAFILICFIDAPFHIENHRENKEKRTSDHEGSEKITREQQNIPKGMCISRFLSQFMSDLLGFWIAILQPYKTFCCEMSVRDKTVRQTDVLFCMAVGFLLICAKLCAFKITPSLFSYEIIAGDKPLFSSVTSS